MTIELINIPEYWRQTTVRPRGFAEICDMVETHGKPVGIWEWKQWNPRTGEIVKREINRNVITDHGAVNVLASGMANASNANPWNCIYINNNSGSCQLSTASGTAAIATGANLAVVSLPADVPLNYPAPIGSTVTQLTLGYGTGTTQTISMNLATTHSATSTSLNIVGFTPSINFPIGTNVVPIPNVGENPSNANLTANTTVTGSVTQYSGVISAGGFTYNATTGSGNRNVVITYVFANSTNGGTTPNGSYTDSWLVNVTSAASNSTSGLFVGNYVAHEINTPMICNNNNNVTVTITIKL